MGKPLSMDLRERALTAYKRGEGTQAEVATLFGIGEATLRRWVRRDREMGSVAPVMDYARGPAPKTEHANLEVLEELMRATPDATNAELAERMEARTGISVSAPTIRRAINLLGWSRKKQIVAREAEAPHITHLRARWRAWQREVATSCLVFIDEAHRHHPGVCAWSRGPAHDGHRAPEPRYGNDHPRRSESRWASWPR